MSVTRVRPIASVLLYDEAAADPVVTDHGYVRYELLRDAHKWGTISRYGADYTLEYLDQVGLTCRPFVVLQDTRSSKWSTSGGSWQERKPLTGRQKYRLVQYSAASNVQWSATSTFPIPENPHFAVSLTVLDTPPGHDADTYPPYVRIELGVDAGGTGQWALEWSKVYGARLLRWVSGGWQSMAELDDLQSIGSDGDEALVLFRCFRGALHVSTDFGRSYKSFSFPDGTPATVRSGKMAVRGQGGACAFGLHQVLYRAGTYDSQQQDTLTSRDLAFYSADIRGRYDNPYGTTVAFSDRSLSQYSAYRASLNPAPITGIPFNFYAAPVLYSTTFRYWPNSTLATATSTTPWDQHLLRVAVRKPFDISAGTCEIDVHQDASSTFSGSYRWRKIRVKLGWLMSDNSQQFTTVFTGYIRSVLPQRDDFGRVVIRITAENAATRFRRTRWTSLDVRPLGGQSLNMALDEILASEAVPLNTSWRQWHTLGDSWLLPAGSAEEPFALTKPNEVKWETLNALVGQVAYPGLELFADDLGALGTVVKNSLTGVSHDYRGANVTDLSQTLLEIGHGIDYSESGTAALVTAQAETGEKLMAWAVDSGAEGTTLNGRFCPWREPEEEEVPGTPNAGILAGRVANIAADSFPLKYEPEFKAFVNLDVARRDQVLLYDCACVGIPDGTAHAVLTLDHLYQVGIHDGEIELTTSAGFRKIW